jgi:tryptophan synthase alpha chain
MRRLGVYILAGWPSAEVYRKAVTAAAQVADFVELGLPSRNPKYDGPYIRRAHGEAEPVEPGAVPGEVYVMAYWEDHAAKPEALFEAAAAAGARGVLAPDLLIDFPPELGRYVELARRFKMEPVFFVPGKFPHGLVRRLASYRPAFIYLGLYAATGIELPVYVERNIKVFREVAPEVFLVAGFAIDSPQKAAAVVRAGADAVVVGTAYLRRLKNSVEEATAFLREIKKAITSI